MHYSIDLETLDTEPSAVVLSIGIVPFNQSLIYPGRLYHPDIQEQINKGRTISGDTFFWWLSQDSGAREAIYSPERFEMKTILTSISEFMIDAEGVWGNGSDFDNVILGSLYTQEDMRRPWSYTRNRDLRTLRLLVNGPVPEYQGTAHNALDDARNQAGIAQALLWKGVQ